MEIIAMGEMKEYLTQNLSNFSNPIILIASNYFAGCSKCGSEASVFNCQLIDKSQVNFNEKHILIEKHKFPFPIYFCLNENVPIPRKLWLGTQKILNDLELIIRKILY